MANCRACTAPLPDDAAVCPACDEPVAAPKKARKTTRARRKEPASDAAPGPETAVESGESQEEKSEADSLAPEATPGNDAMIALTAGVASCALAFLPCLLCNTFFTYMPAGGVTLGCAGIAIWKGTAELSAIEAGTSPLAGKRPANIGRLAGFLGAALGVLTIMIRIAVNTLGAKFFHLR